MKGFYYRFIGHMFPILFVVSQFLNPSIVSISTESLDASLGNHYISIVENRHSEAEKFIQVEEVILSTNNDVEESQENTGEVIVDSILSHTEENTPVEEVITNQSEVTPVVQNSVMIDSIYYSALMNDDGSYFYLDHNMNGVYDNIGVPFIDFRTDFNTRKTILYAHSSKAGNGPFQILQNYMDSSFYYQHPIITINYNGNTYQYQIFSVYVSLADNDSSEGLEYFNYISYSDSRWDRAIHNYKNNSIYDTGVEVSSSDKILILQTCSMDDRYYEKYYRYNLLVMGKLI